MTKFKYNFYLIIVVIGIINPNPGFTARKYTKEDIINLREEVREMFNHAYSGYLKYAYPYDELRPLTCDGVDTWGSYSLTLIDALDTLAVMGNFSEFRRVVDIVTSKANFDANINVSVFETNIRIVGGLLSAHLLSQRAGVELEPGWPCNGPLLRLAEDVAKRLLAAFDTSTGMPYGTVNLRHGVPPGETSVTCTAGVGTFIVEFGTLSRLTGDPIYEEVALNALHALYHHRSSIGLYGNHIDVLSGRWTAQDSGIGAGVDSYLEYLVKGALLVQRPELMAIFNEGRVSIDKYLKRNDWYLWVSMQKGQVTLPVFQSLEAYWPGVLSLIGDIGEGMKSMHNYHQVWKQYGFTPEFYNIAQGQVGSNRESYPLRPELVESAMYLYRATKDPFLLDVGMDILRSIQHSSRTKCGYATIKDCRDHSLENRMESFFLAETTKYLYLLFDPDNFIHNNGQHGRIHTLPSGRECILDAGGYIFNTEAHPIDPGALLCCSENSNQPKRFSKMKSQGKKLSSVIKKDSGPKYSITPLTEQAEDFTLKLPSAFEEDKVTRKEEAFLDRLKNSGAVDVVEVPLPSEGDDDAKDSNTNHKTLSLNMLQMIETLINSNLEEKLLKTHWTRDILKDLVEAMEKAEELMTRKTPSMKKEDKSQNKNEQLEKREPSERNETNSTDQDILENRKLFTNQKNTRTTDNNSTNFNKSLDDESKQNVESSNHERDKRNVPDEESKESNAQNLFKLITNQHFDKIYHQLVRTIILSESEAILSYLSKCSENIELTNNLISISNDRDIKTQFFTKKLRVVVLSKNIKVTILETKKFLSSLKPGENVSVVSLRRLIDLMVDGKTMKEFMIKYYDFMELVKKFIELGKQSYFDETNKVNSTEDNSNISDKDFNNNDDEVRNNFSNEESKNGFQSDSWKSDDISYQVDDTDRVTPVSKLNSGPLFTDKLKLKTESVVNHLSVSLASSESTFDPQTLLERIRDSPKYFRNSTWASQYDLLTCLPQPYHTRIMLSGEFFND